MEKSCKRKRGSNWVEEDKILLQELVKERVSDIENKNTDTNTNNKKKKAWQELEESFNDICKGEKRNIGQLKSQWSLTKIVAKKEMAEYRKELKKTGGGPQALETMVSANDLSVWLPNEFVVDTNEFDSDMIEISQEVETITSPKVVSDIVVAEIAQEVVHLPTDTPSEIIKHKEESVENVVEEKVSRNKKKSAVNNVINEKLEKVVDSDIKCREELHKLKVANEEKKSRNLDFEYQLLKDKSNLIKEKIKYFKSKQGDNIQID